VRDQPTLLSHSDGWLSSLGSRHGSFVMPKPIRSTEGSWSEANPGLFEPKVTRT